MLKTLRFNSQANLDRNGYTVSEDFKDIEVEFRLSQRHIHCDNSYVEGLGLGGSVGVSFLFFLFFFEEGGSYARLLLTASGPGI